MRKTSWRAVNTVAVTLVALALSGCSYNKFSTQEEAINAQWAEVQNQLQRRNDLIPNLVNTVKGYAAHESGIFNEIADSRSKLLAAKSPEETIQAANQQTSALGRLLAVVENYPNLKADAQFMRLQDELAGHREPVVGCPHALQPVRAGLQHAAAEVSFQRDREGLRVQRAPLLGSPAGGAAGAKGRFREVAIDTFQLNRRDVQ